MPKSKSRIKRAKTRSEAKIDWGGSSKKGSGRINLVLAAGAVVAVAAGAFYWWQSAGVASSFEALLADGQPALERVETLPNRGNDHFDLGQSYDYGVPFPTSGPHARVPLNPGFYDEPQAKTQLVHSVEHGSVVIYFDAPGAEAVGLLKDWAGLYSGQWDGVVAVRSPNLGKTVMLTAWRKQLKLDSFDAAAAAAFIDAYRGRGPENPVR